MSDPLSGTPIASVWAAIIAVGGGLVYAIKLIWQRGNTREDQVRCLEKQHAQLIREMEKDRAEQIGSLAAAHRGQVDAMATAHREDLKQVLAQVMDLQRDTLTTLQKLSSTMDSLSSTDPNRSKT